MLVRFLTHPYFVAFGIPAVFLLCGALGKKIVRGKRGWEQADFFLGTELTLGVMSAALIEIFDLIKKIPQGSDPWPPGLSGQVAGSAGFLAVSFFAFIWVLSTHQDWQVLDKDAQDGERRKQRFWLTYVCNAMGIGLMFLFVLGIKGD